MNQIKQQSDFTESSDVKTKKLRITYEEGNLSNNCLENLSNELFYEIFNYLDACNIYKAFENLNIRFQTLLTHSSLSLRINLFHKSKSKLKHFCRHIIIPNKYRILSLHLKGDSLTRDFFGYCNVDSTFNRLESVVLNGLSYERFVMILSYFNSVPRLFSLIIQLKEDEHHNLSDIYQLILRLPYLKYSKLSISHYRYSIDYMSMPINDKPSTIEHLVLGHSCLLSELMSILYHTPHLRRLTCERFVQAIGIGRNEMGLTLLNLTQISFNSSCTMSFDIFEMFIKKISSQLQTLRLERYNDITYFNANRWEQLIKKHMPHLRKFHFDLHISIDDNHCITITPNHESINQFISSFWIERQWLFGLEIHFRECIYSIHSYREKWFDCHVHDQVIPDSNRNISVNTYKDLIIANQRQANTCPIEFNPPIQITFHFLFSYEQPYFFHKMISYFDTELFTYLDLNVDLCGLPIYIFMLTIRRLPNIDSLKMLSLPYVLSSSLSAEDTEMQLSVSITNKITKVKVEEMHQIEQIYFLMDLCPRMRYLEVECTTENNLKNIVKYISMKQMSGILYLNCLCFRVPNANEKMVKNLDIMIDSEKRVSAKKVFRDYTVQRIHDKIFLNWKL